ncbi:MAG: GNAT family N-acetyltransferase [Eisenbergiella sp.]
MVLKTDRLILRNMGQEDYEALCRILKDNDVMYAYEGAFSEKVQEWLDRQTRGIINMDSDSGPLLEDSGRMMANAALRCRITGKTGA